MKTFFIVIFIANWLSDANSRAAAFNGSGIDDQNEDFLYDGRIVGGYSTSILQYPYQVSIQYRGSHLCGGSIISNNIILSAAHCIDNTFDVKSFTVRAGSSLHKYGGQLVAAQRLIKHENYSSATLNNDIAMIVLARHLQFTEYIQPVQLATLKDTPIANTRMMVSGWGLTSESGSVSSILRYVVVRVMDEKTCTTNYKFVASITSEMFCAGYSYGGKDSCQGDSGGPLVGYDNGQLKQYGVVSWGVGCAKSGYPGVYAKVAALRPWIDRKIIEIGTLNGERLS